MLGKTEFQPWVRPETRNTKPNTEITKLANSRFISDRKGRRSTPIYQVSKATQQDKSIFDTSSDESSTMGSSEDEFDEYSYIFSWISTSSGSLPTLGRSRASEHERRLDRSTLSSQQSRNKMQGRLTDGHDGTTRWVAGVSKEGQTVYRVTEEIPFQSNSPSSLRRNAAIRRKSTKTTTALPRVDSTRASRDSSIGHVAQLSTARSSSQPRSTYRAVSFGADDEVLSLGPSWARIDGAQISHINTDVPEASPRSIENSGPLQVADATHTSQQDSCILMQNLCPSTQERNDTTRPKFSATSEGGPRIARTFSQMGIGRVVPTALME
ncbi:hypothetical protein J1614_006035 [Plenodomus biglobosus]|nr:hypothetical protein J1614_006035 [Plenodomus biglobosus]